MITQGDLFQKKDKGHVVFREFFKEVLRISERFYPGNLVEEIYQEWRLEKEATKLMEEEAEKEIELGNDF